MVIWVALGGRGKLWGPIYGALLVNITLSSLSSDLPSLWLFVQGGMFLAVVLYFPDGFAGVWDDLEEIVRRRAGWLAAIATATPLVALAVFVLGEALGLTPGVLRKSAWQSDTVGDVQWKYVVLIVVLGATAAYHWLAKARASVAAARTHAALQGAGSS
jgi:ABC-type branched-subunit amino acid transport system permease subunit